MLARRQPNRRGATTALGINWSSLARSLAPSKYHTAPYRISNRRHEIYGTSASTVWYGNKMDSVVARSSNRARAAYRRLGACRSETIPQSDRRKEKCY